MNTEAWTSASPGAPIRIERSERPTLSIVSVTYGTGSVILQSMASLASCLSNEAVEAEVVVVDHAHPERGNATQQTLRLATSGLRVVSVDRNLGFAGGNELGIAHARGDVICLMNPDTLFGPGAISALLRSAREHPDAIISPTLRNLDGSVQERGQQLSANGLTRPLIDRPDSDDLIELRHDQFASAACWFLSRELHERVGGFDVAYHPAYYEDADYAMRVRAAGGRVLVAPDIDVVHLHGGSTDGPPPDTSQQRALFIDRWGPQLGWSFSRSRR